MGDANAEKEWSSDRSKDRTPETREKKTQSPTHEKPIRKKCIEGPNQIDKPKEEKSKEIKD